MNELSARNPSPLDRTRGNPRSMAAGGPGVLLVLAALLLAVLLALSARPPLPLPSPAATDALADACAGTLGRLGAGLLLGVVIGGAVGALMGQFDFFDTLLGSVVHPLRQVPLFGWIPVIGLWAGLGEAARLSFVTLAVSYVMVIAAHQAVRAVTAREIELARALCLPALQRFRVLVWPSALPSLFAGLRLSLAAAWGACVGAEILMSGGPGLGAYIWSAREMGQLDWLVSGTLTIAALGIASSALLRVIESRALFWQRVRRTKGRA